MSDTKKAFQIEKVDNVATALEDIEISDVNIIGVDESYNITAIEKIPVGHKIALRDISKDEKIIKYGVPIGKATKDIKQGSWVHLNCIQSRYDERSSHLDTVTGVPTDIEYK